MSGSASISISDSTSSTCKILFKNEDPVYEYIKARVYNVPFPKRWTKEGIAKPNVSAIENTKEEGLGIERHKSKRSLVIEVYNDLDVGGLVNDNLNKRLQAKFS